MKETCISSPPDGPSEVKIPPVSRQARGELARTYSFGSVSIFSDVGWAGESDSYRFEDALYSVGVGLSVLDRLIRMDSAWGLRQPRVFRFDLYLDASL